MSDSIETVPRDCMVGYFLLEPEERRMNVKPGTRLVSRTCSTEVVVVRSPEGDIDIRCGGHPMSIPGDAVESASVVDALGGGTELGKRYVDGDGGLELLCTKAGHGSLSVGVDRIEVKAAKPLPASD